MSKGNLIKNDKQKLEEVIAHSHQMFYTHDLNNIFTYVSFQSLGILGYTPEEMAVKWTSLVTENPINKIGVSLTSKALETGKRQGSYMLELRHKNGKNVFVEINESPIKDATGKIIGITGALMDITKRMRIEERYRLLYETSRDAIMILTPPDWRFISGNPATIKMFRAKNEKEFTASNPGDLSSEYQTNGKLSVDEAKRHIGKAMQDGTSFFEWTHKRFDGEEFRATVLLTRMELDGVGLLQATVRDITDKYLAEEMIARKVEELERFQKVVVDRELVMIKLKEKIHALEERVVELEKK